MSAMKPQTRRSRELAKIHVAKKQLGLDDDTYRAVLWTVARVESARDLDAHGRAQVLEHFKSRGWRPAAAKRAGKRPHNIGLEAQLRKIEAQLTDMRLPWSYADTIARQMYAIDRVAWLRQGHQLAGVITALAKAQEKRAAGGAG